MTLISEEKTIKKPVKKTENKAEKTAIVQESTIEKVAKTQEKTTEKVERTQKLEKKDIRVIRNTKVKIVKQENDDNSFDTKKEAIDAQGRAYATGKRKNAIAKVWLKKGSGEITINGKEASEYLQRPILNVVINVPFVITDTQEKFDVVCQVLGGGLSGQAGAIRHGISKALQLYNIVYRPELKSAGLLTRDSRVVERKKSGLIKARKGQVYKRR